MLLAEAALEALDREPGVRALITDLNMPGMKGTALARVLDRSPVS